MEESPLQKMIFREVTTETWSDLEKLFESRGGPKYCWCAVWRRLPRGTDRRDSRAKKQHLERTVAEGTPVGILGYFADEPIAWCSVAPKNTFRPLDGFKESDEAPVNVWSIVCFFVPRRLRGKGVMKRLLQAAIEHARSRGAEIIEAYPVDSDSPSYRFMGFVPSFEKAGFIEVGRAGTRRHVMRLHL